MGITQQLDQCHSLGMNVHHNINYPPYMNNQIGMQATHDLHFQSSPINPFQSTRCKLNYELILLLYNFLSDIGPSSDPNGNVWTNYSLVS
jgi:hypothetical protein